MPKDIERQIRDDLDSAPLGPFLDLKLDEFHERFSAGNLPEAIEINMIAEAHGSLGDIHLRVTINELGDFFQKCSAWGMQQAIKYHVAAIQRSHSEELRDERRLAATAMERALRGKDAEWTAHLNNIARRKIANLSETFEQIASIVKGGQEGVAHRTVTAPKSFAYEDWQAWVCEHLGHLSDRDMSSQIGLSKSMANTIKRKHGRQKAKPSSRKPRAE